MRRQHPDTNVIDVDFLGRTRQIPSDSEQAWTCDIDYLIPPEMIAQIKASGIGEAICQLDLLMRTVEDQLLANGGFITSRCEDEIWTELIQILNATGQPYPAKTDHCD